MDCLSAHPIDLTSCSTNPINLPLTLPPTLSLTLPLALSLSLPPASDIGVFRIALGYQSRVGKDSFANYMIDRYSNTNNTIISISFAEGLYKVVSGIQQQLGMPVVKDPVLLQNIGTLMRTRYGESIWINQLLERVKEHQSQISGPISFIITDLRFPNELLAAIDLGFTTIKITRENRTIDRDQNHISEIALKDVEFDYSIANNGSKQDLFDSIELVMQKVTCPDYTKNK